MTFTELLPWLLAGAGLLMLSAFFSAAELALFGLRRIDREQLARSGRAIDDVILRLLAQSKRVVVSVAIGNEAVNMTLAAIIAGLVCELALGDLWLCGLVAVSIAAPIVILLGDVVPRTLAIKDPIRLARAAARPLAAFATVVTPLRFLIQTSAELLARPFGGSGRPRLSGDLSEEEFRKLVDAGSAQGQVDARERRLIHRVFEFGDKNVGQIMTPRDKVFALSYDLPMARLAKEIAARGFSRVPIYQRSMDNIRGILNAKDLVLTVAGQAPARTLSELLHEPLFVPRTTPLARLFRTFKQKKVHMALVVSEYGKLLGLVTMEDLLTQLFGEIRDERSALQAGVTGVVRRGRGGRTPVPGAGSSFAGEPATPPPPAPPADAIAASASGEAAMAAGEPAESLDAIPVATVPVEITKPFSTDDLDEARSVGEHAEIKASEDGR